MCMVGAHSNQKNAPSHSFPKYSSTHSFPQTYQQFPRQTSSLLPPLYPFSFPHREILCGRLKVRAIIDNLYYFHSADQIDMLYKSFEEEPTCSPISTLESLPPHDSPLNPPFRLTSPSHSPHSSSLRRPHQVQASVLQWFAEKGVERAFPELLQDEFSGLQLKKVISAQQGLSLAPPGFLERRLSRKLTIKL